MAEPHKLLIINESVLATMATNPDYVKSFPFLATVAVVLRTSSTGCGGCTTAASKRIEAINAAKVAIRQLPNSMKARLKQMLNTKQARLKIQEGQRVLTITF